MLTLNLRDIGEVKEIEVSKRYRVTQNIDVFAELFHYYLRITRWSDGRFELFLEISAKTPDGTYQELYRINIRDQEVTQQVLKSLYIILADNFHLIRGQQNETESD